MKVLTVVGARPQFVKAAMVSRVLRKEHMEVLVHTGQHYDENMSDIFFEELHIPKPDYNLGICGGSHSEMTAGMMIALEKVLLEEHPDIVLLYGDTNSTLSAALVAAKMHIPICHVEAGVRNELNVNAEEVNRTCTDCVSTLLLACTRKSMDNLYLENLKDRTHLVGDPMYDAFMFYRKEAESTEHSLIGLNKENVSIPDAFYYLTCHREENTRRDETIKEIFDAMETADARVIYPVHPRNKERAMRVIKEYHYENIVLIEPVGYLTSIYLVNHAKMIVTDSGGLQREAFFAGKQCITMLEFEVWPETMVHNRNQICSPNKEEIIYKMKAQQEVDWAYQPFGNGHAAESIVECIESYLAVNKKRGY